MVIQGLDDYFQNNVHFLRPYQLKDTKLVIDGDSFVNKLYFQNLTLLEKSLGGEYCAFKRVVDSYFKRLLDCGVEPYVVFEGALSRKGTKLGTTLDRFRENLSECRSISKLNKQNEHILPVFVQEIFAQSMLDLGIKSYTSAQNADHFIVSLANNIGAPVLGSDSDFYAYDLKIGYIPINIDHSNFFQLDEVANYDQPNFINCMIYNLEKFIHCFAGEGNKGVSVESMALLATMLGNNFARSQKTAQMCFGFWKKAANVQVGTVVEYKVERILKWIVDRTLGQAISEIAQSCFNGREKRSGKKIISGSMHRYRNPLPPIIIEQALAYVDGNAKFEVGDLWAPGNVILPPKFCVKFHNATLPPFMYNVILNRYVFLPPQVECHTVESAHNCSMPLRQVIYGILLGPDDPNAEVLEYGRAKESNDLLEKRVNICIKLPEFGKLPSLEELENTTARDKRRLLMDVLTLDEADLDGCVKQWRLVTGALVYFLKFGLEINVHQIDAFLVSVIFYNCVLPRCQSLEEAQKAVVKSNSDSAYSSSYQMSIEELMADLELEEIQFARVNLDKYYSGEFLEPPNPSADHNKAGMATKGGFDIYTLHCFTELHLCIYYVSQLNNLLDYPLDNPNPCELYNGRFLYQLYEDLEVKSHLVGKDYMNVETLLGSESALYEIFALWKELITEISGKVLTGCNSY